NRRLYLSSLDTRLLDQTRWRSSDGRNRRTQMSKIKIAVMGFGLVVALSNVAQALDLRIGNGTTWVTVEPSTDDSVGSGRPFGRSQELPAFKRQQPHSTSASRHTRPW